MVNSSYALKKAGLKITTPRINILKILHLPEFHHTTAECLYKKLIDMEVEIGLATVYRVLNQFYEVGIVFRHSFEGGKAIFELAQSQQHDHLICLTCGIVIEFYDELIKQRQTHIARKYNMNLAKHSHYLYGQCTSCNNHCDTTIDNSEKQSTGGS